MVYEEAYILKQTVAHETRIYKMAAKNGLAQIFLSEGDIMSAVQYCEDIERTVNKYNIFLDRHAKLCAMMATCWMESEYLAEALVWFQKALTHYEKQAFRYPKPISEIKKIIKLVENKFLIKLTEYLVEAGIKNWNIDDKKKDHCHTGCRF